MKKTKNGKGKGGKTKTDGDVGGDRHLKERVAELEGELNDLLTIIRAREEETERLESEIKSYQIDMDTMFDAFKNREKELLEELDSEQAKNNVISNLLELVTERAESTQRELEKMQEGSSPKSERRSERSPSAVSAISDVSMGSDEVFAQVQSEKDKDSADKDKDKDKEKEKDIKVLQKDWQEQFKKRILSLELLLTEERERVHAAEKKLSMKDSALSGQAEEPSLQDREKDIMRQELDLCQRELLEASEQIIEMKARVQNTLELYENTKSELTTVKEQLETEKAQSGAKRVKELEEKVRQLQSAVKSEGEKKKADPKETIEGFKEKITLLEKDNKDRENQIEELKMSKTKLEEDNKSKEKEILQKSELMKQKDDIVRQKDELIRQQEAAVKEKEEILRQKENDIKRAYESVSQNETLLKQRENELIQLKDQVRALETLVKDKELTCKDLNDNIRQRDTRLKEKDDMLEKLNVRITEKEAEIKELKDSIAAKESPKKKTKDESAKKTKTGEPKLSTKLKEAEEKLKKLESDRASEISKMTLDNESLQKQVSQLTNEKMALEEEVKKLKDTLKTKEEDFEKERERLELELKQAKEKLQSMELPKKLKQSDVVKSLTSEKETLISEKHKLQDQVNKLQKELQDNTTIWKAEHDELQEIIKEKKTMIDDSSAICERMQAEIDKLKAQVRSSDAAQQQTPSDSAASSAKLRELQNHVTQLQGENKLLKEEVQRQQELQKQSARSLQDMKAKLEADTNVWLENKAHYDAKLKECHDHKKELDDLNKQVDNLEVKLTQSEAKNKELASSAAAEKAELLAEKGVKVSKLTKDTSSSMAARAKLKFQQLDKDPNQDKDDMRKAISKLQKATKELQEQVKQAELAREKDIQEWNKRTDRYRKEWAEQRDTLIARNNKLEEQITQLTEHKKNAAELQCALQKEREKNASDKYQMQRDLENAKTKHSMEKQKLHDLIHEAQRLKDVAPLIQYLQREQPDTVEVKQRSKVLLHINRVSLEEGRSSDGSSDSSPVHVSTPFPRSLSTDGAPFQPFVLPTRTAEYLVEKRATLTAPVSKQTAAADRPSRARHLLRRSLTTQVTTDDYEKATKQTQAATTHTSRASGSLSAFSSRDSSPEKRWKLHRISNLPAPPPSFIISPPHLSPRKTVSADPTRKKIGPLTSQDMLRICERLEKLDKQETSTQEQQQLKERKKLLRRSTSVDSSMDSFIYVPVQPDAAPGFSYTKPLPDTYKDSPASQTLPAAIKIGSEVIVPGSRSQSTERKLRVSHDPTKPSPRTVRRRFYDDYSLSPTSPTSPVNYLSWPERKSKAASARSITPSTPDSPGPHRLEPTPESPEPRRLASIQIRAGKVTNLDSDSEEAKPTKTSSIFLPATSKEKRKLFGAKKASSLDNSAVGSSIARMGVPFMSPAAPTTFEPPSVPDIQPTKKTHKRSSSGELPRSQSATVELHRAPATGASAESTPQPLQITASSVRTTTKYDDHTST